jgi:hypothetical protein
MSDKQIILNQIRTPDGTVLTSEHRHDYKAYIDANGEEYMVDGGNAYLKRNGTKEPFEELSLYDDEPFDIIRQHIKWGTYGKNGDQPLQYKPLKDLEDDHIQAILDTQKQILGNLKGYLIKEQNYRQQSN